MSQERRYRRWKRSSKQFYQERDSYAKKKIEFDILAAREFCASCKREHGFVWEPQTRSIDLESTFAGIACAHLFGLEQEWGTRSITGSLQQKNQWWEIKLGTESWSASTQRLYRFVLLSEMIGTLDERLQKKISQIILKCYDPSQKGFFLRPGKIVTLRHIYEAVAGLMACKSMPPNNILAFVNHCRHASGGYRDSPTKKHPDLQSVYNALAIRSFMDEPITFDETEIRNFLLSCWRGKGFQVWKKHHPNIWDNYCACLASKMLSIDLSLFATPLEKYFASCQAPNGGVRSSVHGKSSSVLRTYAALTTLSLFPKYQESLRPVNLLTGVPNE